MKQLLAAILFIGLYACNEKVASTERSILVDSMIVEGDIKTDPDTVYNGLIKYYEPKSHRLILEATFKDNVYDGHKTRYYPNGGKKIESYFKDDKLHGRQTLYDTTGFISSIQYFYHGLWYGHSLDYLNNEVVYYAFRGFDTEIFFDIHYDSLGTKDLKETGNSFFFYNQIGVTTFLDYGTKDETELGIYILNPPKFHFQYSLCVVDKDSKVVEVIESYDPEVIYTTTTYDPKDYTNGVTLALRLQGRDSRTDKPFTYFEKLTDSE